MARQLYIAQSLDGYIADAEGGVGWLEERGKGGDFGYSEFLAGVGAIAMGRTTYEWILAHMAKTGEKWSYAMPSWVFTHADLEPIEGGDVRFVQDDVAPIHAEMAAAADGKDIWVVGGGDLAAQFAEAGLLDQLVLSIAPVTLGKGRPLFPRPFDLKLTSLEQNRAFACATYDVVGPRG